MTDRTPTGDRTLPCPPGPALVYIAHSDEPEIHIVDDDRWDPERLSARDRALLRALLEYTLERIGHA